MPAANVIQSAIIGFTYDRIDGTDTFITGKIDHVAYKSVRHPWHIQSSAEQYRSFDRSEFLNLCRPGQLAESIADEDSSRYFFFKEVATMGNDGCDTRSDIFPPDE
jgi:hypothetical protein